MISSLCPSLGLSPKMLESTCQIVSPPFKPVIKSKSTDIKGAQTDKGLLWASSWKHLGRHGQVNRERFWPMNHEGSLVHWLEFLYTHWLINLIITGPLKWCPAGLRPWTHGAAVFQSWMLQSDWPEQATKDQHHTARFIMTYTAEITEPWVALATNTVYSKCKYLL